MKPDVSVIPTPDRAIEGRKPLTKLQRARLFQGQKGICGCGCGGKLDDLREGVIDEHVQPLGLLGSNDLANRQLWRKPCSAKKTYEQDLPAIAKAKRIEAREEGTRRPRKPIPGKGFGSVCRGFDGKVKITKKAVRTQAANDGPASSSNREG